jgi:hypothetical protein
MNNIYAFSSLNFKVLDQHQPSEVHHPSTRGTFLGCKVSTEGSQRLEEQVTYLQDCHTPKTAC